MLPEYTIQKRSESESYAIILYHLRKLGIFRNVTESDYGIDFEIERVIGDKVTGRTLKIQVKSSQSLKIRRSDSIPTISGIKQSTLWYWTEISYQINVLLVAVDIATERIYLSRPVFWDAAKQIDGTKRTKTIEFLNSDRLTEIDVSKANSITAEILGAFFCTPPIREQISYHTSLLRGLPRFLRFYSDVHHYDAGVPVEELDDFREFLDHISFYFSGDREISEQFSEEHRSDWSSFTHWRGLSEWHELLNWHCWEPMKILMPAVLKKLNALRQRVIDSGFYWLNKNPEYFEMVTKYSIPVNLNHDELCGYMQRDDPLGLENGEVTSNELRLKILKEAEERLAAQERKKKAEPASTSVTPAPHAPQSSNDPK